VYFLKNRIIFHCRQDIFSPDGTITAIPAPYSPLYKTYAKGDSRDSATEHFEQRVRLFPGHDEVEWPKGIKSDSYDKSFQYWTKIIGEY
jgi:hypothetical protein